MSDQSDDDLLKVDAASDEEEPTVLDLGDMDAAIIFRQNGEFESFMPAIEDDGEFVEAGSPAMVVAVLMYLLANEERFAALEQEFMEHCMNSAQEPVETLLH